MSISFSFRHSVLMREATTACYREVMALLAAWCQRVNPYLPEKTKEKTWVFRDFPAQ
jgi:hypothetical protein